jgi:hypothetical protein
MNISYVSAGTTNKYKAVHMNGSKYMNETHKLQYFIVYIYLFS